MATEALALPAEWQRTDRRTAVRLLLGDSAGESCADDGLLRELNPGPLGPGARIMPLDQAAMEVKLEARCLKRSELFVGQS